MEEDGIGSGQYADLRQRAAVAIRLREGDDFPYYLTSGFPGAFVQAERFLCARDEAGQIVRDSQGSPVLECMCGNVLCGRTDAALPFFTAHGSFWTNSTTKLLASTTEKERQAQRLVPFRTANVALLEGDSLRIAHWRGYEMAGAEEFMLGLIQPLSDFSLDAEAVRARKALEGQTSYRPLTQNLVSRLNGLAAVHNLLSAAEWQPLELSGLAGQVIHASQQMLPRDKQVVIDVAPSPVRVTPDQAHPLALVINELAINTVKHALAGRDRAHITVRITRQDDTLALEFRDDGPGYPQEVVQAKRHRVGVYLLQNLVRSNLRGELSLYNDGGAVTVIRFPAKA
jgi:two-component sensor histidine kinase